MNVKDFALSIVRKYWIVFRNPQKVKTRELPLQFQTDRSSQETPADSGNGLLIVAVKRS